MRVVDSDDDEGAGDDDDGGGVGDDDDDGDVAPCGWCCLYGLDSIIAETGVSVAG